MTNRGDIFVVTVTLDPRPLSSLGLDERFTRIDFTSRCTIFHVLESMAGVLRVSKEDLSLESEVGQAVDLGLTLGEYHDQHTGLCSSATAYAGRRPRREINLKVKHTPPLQQLVTCTVEGSQGRKTLRRATVQLPNTATFGELLEDAREQRYGALDFEGPVYGRDGELGTTLREAWVRNGCKVDGTLHIGLAVVVSFMSESRSPLSLIMGPGDTIGGVKQRVSAEQGHAPITQRLKIHGAAQRLEDDITLEKCCVSGMPVGGFSSAGWGELHLELHLNERADSTLRAKAGDVDGSVSAENWAPAVKGKPSFRGSDSVFPQPLPSPRAKAAQGGSDSQDRRKSKAEFLAVESSPFSSGSGDDQPSGSNPGGTCATVMFALSPSGRALTLTMPPAATVLDAKEQVAGFERIPPCRQRLLWRGIPMEPNSALLFELGVRGGDTLIVGYSVSSVSTCTMTPVVELDVMSDVDVLAEEERCNREHARSGGVHNSSDKSNGLTALHGGDFSAEIADRDEGDIASASDYEEDGGGDAKPGKTADAGARDGVVDLVEHVRRRNEEGEETQEEGTVSPPPPPPPPPSRTAGHGHGKSGGRRAWRSRSKTLSRRGPWDGSSEHGRGSGGRRGARGGALLSYLPSSASSSVSTLSSDPANSSQITRAARVSPAPVAPNRRDATNGIVRGIGSASTGAIYVDPTVGTTQRQEQGTQPGGKGNFFGWAFWRHGCRLPASSISADDAYGGGT